MRGERGRVVVTPRGAGRMHARVLRSTVACLLALACYPTGALGAVRPSDRIGDRAVGSGALRASAPNVRMQAGTLVTEDGRVLWSREPADKRAMASITKIMTAIIVLDRLSLDDTLTVPPDAVGVGESGANLRRGEELTVRDALEALLVKSANDAAVALAVRVSGNENAFVALMNKRARELGLTRTRYANSYGLDEPGHYSTAQDIATLSRYAMTYPAFRDLVRRRAVVIARGSESRRLESSNLLLGRYRGANGIKTGWTSDAGYSVVASARRAGEELVAVVLGTDSESERFDDAARMLDWGFSHYRPMRIATAGSVVGTATVTDYDDRFVPVLAAQDATRTIFDLDGEVRAQALYDRQLKAPVAKGQPLGVLVFTQGGRLVTSVPLVAGASVRAPGFVERIRIALGRWWRSILD